MKGNIAQRRQRDFHVALLIETSHEFGRDVLRGIRDYEKTLARHWAFYLQPDGMRQDVPHMRAWPCTGVIARGFNPGMTGQLVKSGLPLVLLDPQTKRPGRNPALTRIPYITTDTDAIVRMAFDHLRSCGCRSFAFVHSFDETVWSAERGQAFATLAAAHGFSCAVYGTRPQTETWGQDLRSLGAWLKRLPRGLGVFAAMDQRGRHVIEACREAGLCVPDDIVVLGVDNDSLLCELCEPSLSSIAIDAHRAGFEAARTLHARMRGEPVPPGTRIVVKPTHVSRRQSTAPGFDRDPLVAGARRYLFDHFADRAVQIADIARHCGVSRRLLETRFAQAMGRTLLQELTGLRMEHARTLLLDSTESVTAVATASGFTDPNYFTKAFRKHHGTAPLAYRNRARAV
ncbi:MAG: XylR family transcriptional regulator [Kiritimatiellia bacterium]|jgi:LacI family transcriptional regulator|nr:XylR family transcriptional regulator [Kiritimatiellia bacterium]